MSISLPPSLRSEVEQLIKNGGYGSASEYIRELVRDDLKRRAQEEIESRLLRALDSGPSRELTRVDMERFRRLASGGATRRRRSKR